MSWRLCMLAAAPVPGCTVAVGEVLSCVAARVASCAAAPLKSFANCPASVARSASVARPPRMASSISAVACAAVRAVSSAARRLTSPCAVVRAARSLAACVVDAALSASALSAAAVMAAVMAARSAPSATVTPIRLRAAMSAVRSMGDSLMSWTGRFGWVVSPAEMSWVGRRTWTPLTTSTGSAVQRAEKPRPGCDWISA